MILLDSRCPPLHFPNSLAKYLETLRPLRKLIFVLTKCDITGPERTELWKQHLEKTFPAARVVAVESYLTKSAGDGQGRRKVFEPFIPTKLRGDLVGALKASHEELCTPPPAVKADPNKLNNWKPCVFPDVNWDAVKGAQDKDVSHKLPDVRATSPGDDTPETLETTQNYISVGLIGTMPVSLHMVKC